MADELFDDLLDDLLDDLPEWTNLRELLSAIEEQMGRKVRDEIEETLEDRDVNEVINVRELLSDIQDELGSSYFDSLLHDNDDSADMDNSGTTQE